MGYPIECCPTSYARLDNLSRGKAGEMSEAKEYKPIHGGRTERVIMSSDSLVNLMLLQIKIRKQANNPSYFGRGYERRSPMIRRSSGPC